MLFENWCAFFDKSPFNIQSPRLGLEQCAPRTPYPSHDSNPLPQTPKAFGRFTFPSRPRYFFPPKQFGRFSVESGIIHFPISFSNTSFICSPFNPPIQIPRIPPRRTSRYHRSFQNFSPSKTTWRDILRPPPHASGSKSKHIRIRFRFWSRWGFWTVRSFPLPPFLPNIRCRLRVMQLQLAWRRFGDPIPLIRSLSLSWDAYLNPGCGFQRAPSPSPLLFSLSEPLLSLPLPELGFSTLLFLFLLILLLAAEVSTKNTVCWRAVEGGEEVLLNPSSFFTLELLWVIEICCVRGQTLLVAFAIFN